MLAFLAARATPGVEAVWASGYRRTIAIDGNTGTIAISRSASAPALDLRIRFANASARPAIAERVRRMFDLDADPAAIAKRLAGDRLLASSLTRHPGIRTPGAWDGFELAVRAILGQQVSVAAATTVAGRLAKRFGTAIDDEDGLDRIFPAPAQLADASIETVGVIRSRAEAIRTLARAVTDGRVTFGMPSAPAAVTHALQALPGIGPWTAQYIAMRALGDRDAFPSGDLILRRLAGDCSARELERRSQRWRPWRAYAVMLLWQSAGDRARDAAAAKVMDGVARLSPRSPDARGNRGGTGRGQEHARPAARRPVPQRVVRRR
jgi:AraC family transcriptional regulator of adaptative response / DNA-3-methyladenine glycosylase II